MDSNRLTTTAVNATMPVLFVSHGNPMLALDQEIAEEYRGWAANLPRPEALLIFSAHWETPGLVFGETVRHEKLVYDFYGFSDRLYQLQYPAPGAEWLADKVRSILNEDVPQSRRGLDHGVWVPLLHMWPEADLPILQMSLPSNAPSQSLFELGRRLSPLRQQGVMIIGAGTLSHNLREGLSGRHTEPPEWVSSFDKWLENVLLHDRKQLLDWKNRAPDALRNHPTPEHFNPLLITAGAANDEEQPTFPMVGFDMGVFSKRSVQFG